MSRNYIIVLASGFGVRLGSSLTPKHLYPLKGIELINWTVNTLIESNLYDKIVVVTQQSHLEMTINAISKINNFESKLFTFDVGAIERMASFFNGLKSIVESHSLNPDDTITLLDANRPLTNVDQLKNLVKYTNEDGSACLARPVVNGVAEIFKNKIVLVPSKERYVEFVTPESIKFKILEKIFTSKNVTRNSLVEIALHESVHPIILESSELNSKLTYIEDLNFLESLVEKYRIIGPAISN